MNRILKVVLVVLFFVGAVSPAWAVSPVFATKAQDIENIDALLEQTDADNITLEEALVSALNQGISFRVIVDACTQRGISLGKIITAAATIGISAETILTWMSDADVSQSQMLAAQAEATGQIVIRLGYTPEQAEAQTKILTVTPITSNPGGFAPLKAVSPSTL